MQFQKTDRGFLVLRFTDRYGVSCSLQQSSLATESAVWFGPDKAEPRVLASQAAVLGVQTTENTGWVPYPIPETVQMNTRMHLTRKQVAELLPHLQRFVDTGELQPNNTMSNNTKGCARLESEARIIGDELVIKLKISTLAHAAQHSDYFFHCQEDGVALKITDEAAFAESVASALNREEEDGSTPITRMLDEATEWVSEQGWSGIEEV